MTARLFHYLSPKIVPAFPAEVSTVYLLQDLQHALRTRSSVNFTGTLSLTTRIMADGQEVTSDTRTFSVNDGIVQGEPDWLSFNAPAPGYVEVDCVASEPVFHRIIPEPGYAIMHAPKRGVTTINTDMKYANPRIVQQIRSHHEFCLLHASCLSDAARGLGNSLLLINPYDRPLVARLAADTGGATRTRISPRTAVFVDLAEILADGRWATVMLTASNRVIAYDVRHKHGQPLAMNSLDHLDPFSGFPTHLRAGLAQVIKAGARQALRDLGVSY